LNKREGAAAGFARVRRRNYKADIKMRENRDEDLIKRE
jgi:hypothetical protein